MKYQFKIILVLICMLLFIGCGNAIKALESVQKKYAKSTVILLPGSINQFIVIKDDNTIRYIVTNDKTMVNSIHSDILLYKKMGKTK